MVSAGGGRAAVQEAASPCEASSRHLGQAEHQANGPDELAATLREAIRPDVPGLLRRDELPLGQRRADVGRGRDARTREPHKAPWLTSSRWREGATLRGVSSSTPR